MTQESDQSGPVVVLIGSPGAGKSTVGRRVAQRLGVEFADSDALIEQEAGMSVADLFVTEGEGAFRQREVDTIAAALRDHTGVVSLGGGSVMRAETRELLVGRRIVWLKVSLSDAAARVGLNTARPLLLGNVRATLGALLAERSPVYEDVATDVVDTSGSSLREVVDAVVAVLGQRPIREDVGQRPVHEEEG
ncbi:MAG: shikimate kinase [Candidatus Nanopelagicales bacterium]|nr:shikimate kinase [Candidatus Nanopelagicales bacterium]MCF8538297.1 shikimate kinase [Candidatus Nanopelagicales bacterium]MCF8543098.1 shikimate kinase [Candidatus Nanopelagicales bacterium]MCF8556537.1 shikimate kinase [Candidatus Nanopelagicales bacterium]